ncbi:MAG: site-specific integrase [Cyclobacteriaceae bacterium]|nr:site-specific integrase [Cyclobacteriaceae bacterium]
MEKEGVKAEVVLLKRTLLKRESEKRGEKVYPVKLRITDCNNGHKQRYYAVKASLTENEFVKARAAKRRPVEFDKYFNLFNEVEVKSKKIIDQMEVFTFEDFLKRYDTNRDMDSVLSCFDDYREDLIQNSKAGTANVYNDAANSIRKFLKTKNIGEGNFKFKNISVKWLKDYQKYMQDLGRSKSTIGFYLRPLRTIMNRYSKLDTSLYPFGNSKQKFTIPSGKGRKVFLEEEEIKTFFASEPKTDYEQLALDLYKFSFFANGCNMKDIMILKKADVDLANKVLYLKRAKTEDTEAERTEVKVTLNSFMMGFIFKYQDAENEIYQFKFINPDPDMEPDKWLKRKRDFIGTINENLNAIASRVETKKNVTHGTARHTFATTLLRKEIPIKEISRRLCHNSITTTENYLHGLGHKVEMKADAVLDEFEQFA